MMELCDMIQLKPSLNCNDSLLAALNLLVGGGQYRVVVTDDTLHVKGTISGRRALEVLLGRRGGSIRAKKGLRSLLREPINLFLDEAHQLFPEGTHPQVVLQYMAENSIGYIIVVDQLGAFKGVVEELSILDKLRGKFFGLKVQDIMRKEVYMTSPDVTLFEASNIMVDYRIRRLPVVINNAIIGILTISDILNYVLKQEKDLSLISEDIDVYGVLSEKVRSVMSPQVVTIDFMSDVGEAIDKVLENNVSGLPVVSKDGKLIGMISRIDLIEKLVKAKGTTALLDIMVK